MSEEVESTFTQSHTDIISKETLNLLRKKGKGKHLNLPNIVKFTIGAISELQSLGFGVEINRYDIIDFI